jgi:hypothetical protein
MCGVVIKPTDQHPGLTPSRDERAPFPSVACGQEYVKQDRLGVAGALCMNARHALVSDCSANLDPLRAADGQQCCPRMLACVIGPLGHKQE